MYDSILNIVFISIKVYTNLFKYQYSYYHYILIKQVHLSFNITTGDNRYLRFSS